MFQLISHLLIILLLYRSYKLFFLQWNSWHVFLFGWSACLFVVVAITSTQYLTFWESEVFLSLKIGFVCAVVITLLYIASLSVVLVRLYVNLTEWFWGSFYWVLKDLFFRSFSKYFYFTRNINTLNSWYWTQFEYEYLSIHPKVIIVKILRFLFFSFIFIVAIGKYDLGMYHELCLNYELNYIFKPYNLLMWPIYLYFFLLFFKYILIYLFPCYNNGFKHVGLIYRNQLAFLASREWLYEDIITRYKKTRLKYVWQNLRNKYDIPLCWTSWQQTIVDHIPFIFFKGKILGSESWKYQIVAHDLVLKYKRSRFDEFSYEIWPLDVRDTREKKK